MLEAFAILSVLIMAGCGFLMYAATVVGARDRLWEDD